MLGGCASLATQFTAFEESSANEKARLRVVSDGLVKGVPAHRCIDWSAPGSGTILGGMVSSSGLRGRSLGMTSASGQNSNAAEFYVDAGKPLTLVYLTTPENRYRCSVGASFVPEKGKDYQATFVMDTAFCRARIQVMGAPEETVSVTNATPC